MICGRRGQEQINFISLVNFWSTRCRAVQQRNKHTSQTLWFLWVFFANTWKVFSRIGVMCWLWVPSSVWQCNYAKVPLVTAPTGENTLLWLMSYDHMTHRSVNGLSTGSVLWDPINVKVKLVTFAFHDSSCNYTKQKTCLWPFISFLCILLFLQLQSQRHDTHPSIHPSIQLFILITTTSFLQVTLGARLECKLYSIPVLIPIW